MKNLTITLQVPDDFETSMVCIDLSGKEDKPLEKPDVIIEIGEITVEQS